MENAIKISNCLTNIGEQLKKPYADIVHQENFFPPYNTNYYANYTEKALQLGADVWNLCKDFYYIDKIYNPQQTTAMPNDFSWPMDYSNSDKQKIQKDFKLHFDQLIDHLGAFNIDDEPTTRVCKNLFYLKNNLDTTKHINKKINKILKFLDADIHHELINNNVLAIRDSFNASEADFTQFQQAYNSLTEDLKFLTEEYNLNEGKQDYIFRNIEEIGIQVNQEIFKLLHEAYHI